MFVFNPLSEGSKTKWQTQYIRMHWQFLCVAVVRVECPYKIMFVDINFWIVYFFKKYLSDKLEQWHIFCYLYSTFISFLYFLSIRLNQLYYDKCTFVVFGLAEWCDLPLKFDKKKKEAAFNHKWAKALY